MYPKPIPDWVRSEAERWGVTVNYGGLAPRFGASGESQFDKVSLAWQDPMPEALVRAALYHEIGHVELQWRKQGLAFLHAYVRDTRYRHQCEIEAWQWAREMLGHAWDDELDEFARKCLLTYGVEDPDLTPYVRLDVERVQQRVRARVPRGGIAHGQILQPHPGQPWRGHEAR